MPDTVKIRSWNARENAYKEIEVSYEQILNNLKATKISFLVKNIYKIGDAPIEEETYEETKSFNLSVPSKGNPQKQTSAQDTDQTNSKPVLQITSKAHGKTESKPIEPVKIGPGIMGPKNKLTQVPMHKPDEANANLSFEFGED